MKAAQASLETYKLNLEFCTITSPIDGQAGRFNQPQGNLIMQDSTRHWTLHSIVDSDAAMKAEFERIVGIPVKYEMLSCAPWRQNLLLADRYGDGRVFLNRSKETYDLILLDAYRGGFVPFHLLTREFYELVKQRLSPGGSVASNVHDGTKLYHSTVKTFAAVFPALDLYPNML